MTSTMSKQTKVARAAGALGPAALAGAIVLGFGLSDAQAERLKGTIRIDGSSTVYPITEAVAEEYRYVQPKVRVTVGISGTGGGFKKFCHSETDISDASRPIKGKEQKVCRQAGIEYIELPVAFDALSVVIHPDNDWATEMTVQELTTMWSAGTSPSTWSDVREGWPDRELKLYGPGTDSGTFDYFVEAILGKSGSVRPDFTASEDDNVLVQGVAADKDALGFFGFAYYLENKDKLTAVKIDAEQGLGPIEPAPGTVRKGQYTPLSRPIFIYVRKDSADRPEVQDFVNFYLKNAPKLVSEVGYVPLPESAYKLIAERFAERKTGSVFQGVTIGVELEDILKREGGA